jgi:hypothetical protein
LASSIKQAETVGKPRTLERRLEVEASLCQQAYTVASQVELFYIYLLIESGFEIRYSDTNIYNSRDRVVISSMRANLQTEK